MPEITSRSWERHYAAALKRNPLEGVRALLAYNSVVDKVRSVDEDLLSRLRTPKEVPPIYAKAAKDLDDLAEGLCYSISNGLALEVICSPQVIRFLEDLGGYEEHLGGQVAIVARLLSDFGAARVLVHPDRFNRRLASLYRGGRAEVPLRIGGVVKKVKAEEFYWDCEPEVHYILEYPAGLSFGDGPAPRANRFIAAPMTKVLFHREWEEALPAVSKGSDVFFIAGLNHMGEDYEESFRRVREHIRTSKASNPSLVVHLEITSVPDLRKREAIVDDIMPLVDSVGVNEAELADLAFLLGLPRWEEARRNAVYQLEAMYLIRALGVKRVNMHTLGYYLALSPNPAVEVRNSLLFAALVAVARAALGRSPRPEDLSMATEVPLAERGLKEMERLSEVLKLKGLEHRTFLQEGWCAEEGLVAVPARVVEDPRYTVGLGDTISGASIFSERWG
ncbi:MAG: ADP-dependent glucokinase/phosphofructokinase [Thermoplasmata archaeon]